MGADGENGRPHHGIVKPRLFDFTDQQLQVIARDGPGSQTWRQPARSVTVSPQHILLQVAPTIVGQTPETFGIVRHINYDVLT